MIKTNVEYYGVGFDSAGNRICAHICEFDPKKEKNAIKVEELLKKVKETENVAVAEIVDSDTYNQYLNGGCVRDKETGKPVAYVPPELTAEEKAASKQASLDAEYTAAQQKLGQSLLVANLNNDTDTAASIQNEYADLNTYYKEQSDAIAASMTGDGK